MPMYNLCKTSESLWQYQRDDTKVNTKDSKSFKFKVRITGRTSAVDNTKNVEIAVPLKFFRKFWKTSEHYWNN